MKKIIFFALALLAISCSTDTNENSKPNIIYILADDLGYGELGINGQKLILTPNIDALATTGMIFTEHYLYLKHHRITIVSHGQVLTHHTM